MSTQDQAARAMRAALGVITLDPRIRRILSAIDPRALAQCDAAFGAASAAEADTDIAAAIAADVRRLRDNPAAAAREQCYRCARLIGDAEYMVTRDGMVRHQECPIGRRRPGLGELR